MATAPSRSDDAIDRFLADNGHDVREWEQDRLKKRCPECGSLHDDDARQCSVCEWRPGGGR